MPDCESADEAGTSASPNPTTPDPDIAEIFDIYAYDFDLPRKQEKTEVARMSRSCPSTEKECLETPLIRIRGDIFCTTNCMREETGRGKYTRAITRTRGAKERQALWEITWTGVQPSAVFVEEWPGAWEKVQGLDREDTGGGSVIRTVGGGLWNPVFDVGN